MKFKNNIFIVCISVRNYRPLSPFLFELMGRNKEIVLGMIVAIVSMARLMPLRYAGSEQTKSPNYANTQSRMGFWTEYRAFFHKCPRRRRR